MLLVLRQKAHRRRVTTSERQWGNAMCCPMPVDPSVSRRFSILNSIAWAFSSSLRNPTSSFSTTRSEERRVGEEGRSRWAPYHLKKKKKRGDRSDRKTEAEPTRQNQRVTRVQKDTEALLRESGALYAQDTHRRGTCTHV